MFGRRLVDTRFEVSFISGFMYTVRRESTVITIGNFSGLWIDRLAGQIIVVAIIQETIPHLRPAPTASQDLKITLPSSVVEAGVVAFVRDM